MHLSSCTASSRCMSCKKGSKYLYEQFARPLELLLTMLVVECR